MKKLAILMTLILASSTAVLANPFFEDKGAEASNALYQTNCCFDYTTDHKVELTLQTWSFSDFDSDADGIADIVIGAEIVDNQLQITSTDVSKRSARTDPIRTEEPMNKAELIEAIASIEKISRTDAEEVLGEILLEEGRDM